MSLLQNSQYKCDTKTAHLLKMNRTKDYVFLFNFSFRVAYHRPDYADSTLQCLVEKKSFGFHDKLTTFFSLFSACMNGGRKCKTGEGYQISREAGDSEKQAKIYEAVKGWNFTE